MKKQITKEIVESKTKFKSLGIKSERIITGQKPVNKVDFRLKSPWQKDDCIACKKKSTIEAVFGDALVRCCEDRKCMERAAELAVISGK